MGSPLYYTFGNHMHWVDMEWLWGYSTLPGSARDMLHYCAASGAKGQINFDGIGYEKLAVQTPEVITELRQAIQAGQIEVSGASYGQPYGLFQGGESNVRQRIYGARTVRRLLGVWPRTFWEEEFDFFPQLPQMLRQSGFQYASLFFQWTWHTPIMPQETLPAIWWEGQDGSALLTSPRNALNLHQWPEEFENLLANPLLRQATPPPCIVQWLELMPSRDWMCRSELILPQLQWLVSRPDFEICFTTLPEYLEIVKSYAQPRRYTLNDVFHGTSLGKNGDFFPRTSRRAEQTLLTAETLAALAGLWGRPYPNWDVYPTWELEEAWRETLSAQHHDNQECEGLCGYVGLRSYERSLGLSQYVIERTLRLLARRTLGSSERMLVCNPLGWDRRVVVTEQASGRQMLLERLPAFGHQVIEPSTCEQPPAVGAEQDQNTITLQRGKLRVVIDRGLGVVTQIFAPSFEAGMLLPGESLGDIHMTRHGLVDRFESVSISLEGTTAQPVVCIIREGRDGSRVVVEVRLAAELDAVDIHFNAHDLPRPDGRFAAALRTILPICIENARLVHDHPYGVSEVRPSGSFLRKYPTGDWMTSPQEYETIEAPFTGLQFVDFDADERGVLFLHDGSQAYQWDGQRVHQILSMYDPWDEEYFIADLDARIRVIPHASITNAARWKLAQEFTRPALAMSFKEACYDLPSPCGSPGSELLAAFSAVFCTAPNVAVTAFYRETEEAGRHLEHYAGSGMEYPFVLRLVELDGKETSAQVSFSGHLASAIRTDLLGQPGEQLAISEELDEVGRIISRVTLLLRPYAIATIYLDIVEGRKQYRDLDARREVWAKAHRTEK